VQAVECVQKEARVELTTLAVQNFNQSFSGSMIPSVSISNTSKTIGSKQNRKPYQPN
jgi:hypothetical protein